MSSGLPSFSPQGPQGRRDHQGLQAPQAPKVTGARRERRAQRGLRVRTPYLTLSPRRGGVSPLSEQASCVPRILLGLMATILGGSSLTSSLQHPHGCPIPSALGPGLTVGCREKRRLWDRGCWRGVRPWGAGGCSQPF